MFFALCWQSRSHHEFSLTSAQQTSAPPAYQHGTQKASIQQQPLRTPVLDSMLLSGDQGQTSETEDCLGRGWQGAGNDLASGFARRASHLRKRGRWPSAAFNRRVRCLRVCDCLFVCVCVCDVCDVPFIFMPLAALALRHIGSCSWGALLQTGKLQQLDNSASTRVTRVTRACKIHWDPARFQHASAISGLAPNLNTWKGLIPHCQGEEV